MRLLKHNHRRPWDSAVSTCILVCSSASAADYREKYKRDPRAFNRVERDVNRKEQVWRSFRFYCFTFLV